MVGLAQRNLRQEVTYWAPQNGSETNDFGHANVGNGVVMKGRWEEHSQQIRKTTGEEITSTTTVFVTGDVAIGGFLKLGSFDGEPLPGDALEIQDYRVTPDLRNLSQERRAFL